MPQMTIRKAVIPVAGFGTRMLPAAKAVPKELLPILDRPTIQYVVEEAADAGIDDVLLVTSREKKAIEDHFDRNPELEERLKSAGREALLASLDALMGRIQIHAVRQPKQRGLGDTIAHARRHVGDEPFLCLLGDTIFSGVPAPGRQLIDAATRLGTSVIGLEEVAPEKVDRYGIVAGEALEPGLLRLHTIVEKPSKQAAPSRLAIAARYVLTPGIFSCLGQIGTGVGGEIQLTDALALLSRSEPVHGLILQSKRHDIGNPLDWLKTNLLWASRDEKLRAALAPMVRELFGA